MSRSSMLYAVLSQEKIQPLDQGQILSIMNNSFHPVLNIQGVTAFQEASALIQSSIANLKHLSELLREYPIRLNEFNLALNYLNGYIYILDVTCDIPQNLRLASYAKSAKAGAA